MIQLIPIREEDLVFLNDVRNEAASEYLHDSRTFTLEETTNWFKSTKPKFWIIWYNGNRIGYFRTSNYSEINRNIYIGADLHKDFRGKGLAYESYCKFMPILFKELNLHKISLEVLETNIRAINLYKKLGFKVEGIKREEVFKNNVWINSIIMSILKDEWVKKTNNYELEECILCKKETDVPKDMHIDLRKNYVEGAGQLCPGCYLKLYDTREDKGSGNR